MAQCSHLTEGTISSSRCVRMEFSGSVAMMYFTHSSRSYGGIQALYNGRFAFVAALDPRAAIELPLIVEQRPGSSTSSPLQAGVLNGIREEFDHFSWFLECKTGLLLNGLRLVARIAWLAGRREVLPRLYYSMRSQFYLRMYELHESLVKLSRGPKLHPNGLAKLRQADEELFRAWESTSDTKSVLRFRTILCAIGRLFTRHFTVVAVASDRGRAATNVALGGWINTSGSFGDRQGSLVERLLVWLRPEALIHLGPLDLWRWMLLKFEVEATAVRIGKANSREAFAYYATYVQKTLAFLSVLMAVADQRAIYQLESILLALWETPGPPMPAGWESNDELLAVVGFFYGHGN